MKDVADELGINYSTAKTIIRTFKKNHTIQRFNKKVKNRKIWNIKKIRRRRLKTCIDSNFQTIPLRQTENVKVGVWVLCAYFTNMLNQLRYYNTYSLFLYECIIVDMVRANKVLLSLVKK